MRNQICYYSNKTAVGNFKTVQFVFLPADETEAPIQLEKKPCSLGGKMFCQISMKELQDNQLVRIVMILGEKGSQLFKDIFICGQHFTQHDYCGHIWTLQLTL